MKGITVSCDLNYRKKLWSKEKANKVMSELVTYVDVLISNEEDSKDVFSIEADNTDITSGKISKDGYVSIGKKLMEKFPNLKNVAFTLRESISASQNGWSAILMDKDNVYASKKYMIQIVDRLSEFELYNGLLEFGFSQKSGILLPAALGNDNRTAGADSAEKTYNQVVNRADKGCCCH